VLSLLFSLFFYSLTVIVVMYMEEERRWMGEKGGWLGKTIDFAFFMSAVRMWSCEKGFERDWLKLAAGWDWGVRGLGE
jgi:hypothetical protein